jgi:hypothetical protein
VVGRKTDRARVLAEIVEPQRYGLVDQNAEDAAAARRIADRCPSLVVDARGEEPLEPRSGGVDHPERRVACARQLGGRLH